MYRRAGRRYRRQVVLSGRAGGLGGAQIVIGGRNKYMINGVTAQPTRVQDLFHSVQLNVNNPHFLIMQVNQCIVGSLSQLSQISHTQPGLARLAMSARISLSSFAALRSAAVLSQGRIMKVLNMKPPEILSMLEEAAGTRMYETKRTNALKTLDKKDTKVSEINKVRLAPPRCPF